jgi:hypothetical protein
VPSPLHRGPEGGEATIEHIGGRERAERGVGAGPAERPGTDTFLC